MISVVIIVISKVLEKHYENEHFLFSLTNLNIDKFALLLTRYWVYTVHRYCNIHYNECAKYEFNDKWSGMTKNHYGRDGIEYNTLVI